MFRLDLGIIVTDRVSGFTGMITGRAEYSTGCRQYIVVPTASADGTTYNEAHWFDEERLLPPGETVTEKKGGPQALLPPKH